MTKKTKSKAKELVLVDETKSFVVPKEQVKFAREAAVALMDIVKTSNWVVKIGKKDYLVFEAWQTLARFFNYSVKTVESKFIDIGGAKGFEASVVVVDRAGIEIGGADAMCLDNEANWKGKPLFTLRSMAQTRASAKALRQILGWVAVLAGYKPTPAEEMDGVTVNGESHQKSPDITTVSTDKLKSYLEEIERMTMPTDLLSYEKKLITKNTQERKFTGQEMYLLRKAISAKLTVLKKK